MGSFSLAHWLIVIVVLLLIFGPKRLSEVGKGLGQGIRNFKKGVEGDSDAKSDEEEEPRKLSKKRDADAPRRLKSAADEVEEEEEEEEELVVRPRKKKKVRRES